MIDDKAYCVPSDSWGYADFGLPLKNYVRHADNLHYLEGAMLGHNPLQVWVRKVIVIDPAIWMIVDEVKCDGAHEAHTRLHFDPSRDRIPGRRLPPGHHPSRHRTHPDLSGYGVVHE